MNWHISGENRSAGSAGGGVATIRSITSQNPILLFLRWPDPPWLDAERRGVVAPEFEFEFEGDGSSGMCASSESGCSALEWLGLSGMLNAGATMAASGETAEVGDMVRASFGLRTAATGKLDSGNAGKNTGTGALLLFEFELLSCCCCCACRLALVGDCE